MIISSWCPLNITVGSNSTPKPGFTLQLFTPLNVIFQDCWRSFFQSVVNLRAVTGHLLCGSHFVAKYFLSLQEFEFELVLSPEFVREPTVDMTNLNRLVQLRHLKLTGVDLIVQPVLGIMFHNLTRLESLSLIECRILTLEEDLSRDLHSLILIQVQSREEFSMLEGFPEPLTSLRYMEFFGPRLHCSCDNAWLDNWVRRQRQVQVIV
ncbi:leucine-rich repeat-containing protein 4B-like [Salmo trutta]|uniref:leucine-rich repeat-containing protein 4B-like n=1 Tax=Salmo trutta TaxID=8032 RepID=UPI00113117FB|nr:leucine-rich repeat-containing protein 4B-like [Salmo trutta]